MFTQEMAQFNERFYKNLDATQNALRNWRKLKILIVLLRICGGHVNKENDAINGEDDDVVVERSITCRERIAPYVMKPDSIQKIFWDIFMGIVYLVCFWLDPFCIGTAFRVYEDYPDLNTF